MANHGEKQYKKEVYKGLTESTQTFPGIGLLEARCGDVILRGRNGIRDYLYPIDKAIRRYIETKRMVAAMARNAIRGWDTLMDIQKEMLSVIAEAYKQRLSMNIEVPKHISEFLEHEGAIKTISPVAILENKSAE